MIPLADVVAHYRRMQREVPRALEREVRTLMEGVAKDAKDMLGQEHPDIWAPLQPATLADKARQRFDVPSPLRRTGDLADSIGVRVTVGLRHIVGEVGSNLPYAETQEHGSSAVPPRPFLSSAMIKAEPVIREALGRLAQRALTPGEVP